MSYKIKNSLNHVIRANILRRRQDCEGKPKKCENSNYQEPTYLREHVAYEGLHFRTIWSTEKCTVGNTELIIRNLDPRIIDIDIIDLFSGFGPIKRAGVHYDASGNSLGIADVLFVRRYDAMQAMREYDGVPFYENKMVIELIPKDTPTPESYGCINSSGHNNSSKYGVFESRYSQLIYNPWATSETVTDTILTINNLSPEVSDKDIRDLFSGFKSIKRVGLHFDQKGKSLLVAEAIFSSRHRAIRAFNEFTGVPMYGKRMVLSLKEVDLPSSPNYKEPRVAEQSYQKHRCNHQEHVIGGERPRVFRENTLDTAMAVQQALIMGPAKVAISNLHPNVTDTNLEAYFSAFGHLLGCCVNLDYTGRSVGTAEVVFANRQDAVRAINECQGVPYNGKPMYLQLFTRPVSAWWSQFC